MILLINKSIKKRINQILMTLEDFKILEVLNVKKLQMMLLSLITLIIIIVVMILINFNSLSQQDFLILVLVDIIQNSPNLMILIIFCKVIAIKM